jgi:two-component system cell cycle sensor histidine kinase/response regulator CckA
MTSARRSVHRSAAEGSPSDLTSDRVSGARTPIHVLLVEDSTADADLILYELRRGGYDVVSRRVAGRRAMLDALKDPWQIVLLDYTMENGETAMDALASLATLGIDLPAILISGGIGEEECADALRAGARDYVSKGNLTRLVPAVARELAQVDARRLHHEGEEALRQSEQRLRLALAAGGMGAWEWNLVSGRLFWSAAVEAMFGLEPGTFGGTYAEFIGLVHPDDRDLVGASVEQALEHDAPAVVYRAVWQDGTIRWHERKALRAPGPDGLPKVMAGVTFDVTEREEAAQSLRESEERFRLIAEHAQDLIALLDADGRCSYVSPSCESILGYSAAELLGTVASGLIHPDDWKEQRTWDATSLREVRMRRADGSWLWVEGLSYEVTGRVESHFAVIERDISERKREEIARELLEGELRQAQKMEAFGQLAGGIAHDFNNLLTVISGYTEILLSRLGREAEGGKEIAAVSQAAARAAQLTGQLLAYSRKQVFEPRVLDLNDVVTETLTMLERVTSDNIEFVTTLARDLGHINADSGQIGQIIMNLVMNARDAMPEGGTLRLVTGNASLDRVRAKDLSDIDPGDYVVLTVTDTGQGMDAATARRVFEPYFTTKERGAGSGLGLSTVYGIVRQSGGRVEVESELGVGTTFRLSFPLVSQEIEAFSPKPIDGRSLMGSETVLLVEDDEALRGVAKEMLETYGYRVLLAPNGAQGLELARDRSQPIQLLMTDILMPKMGGIELADRLKELRPEVKILYTSGHNDSGGVLQMRPGTRYLQKPYGMQNLARTLRDLLERPAAGSAASAADQ